MHLQQASCSAAVFRTVDLWLDIIDGHFLVVICRFTIIAVIIVPEFRSQLRI
jgi:hypothetical protein